MNIDLPEWSTWWDTPVNENYEPVRHRVARGGRGGSKSWTLAFKLAERARQTKIKAICLREFQNSLRESSRQLVINCIDRMGLGPSGDGFFKIGESELRGANGSVILFLGFHGREAAIKSFEGCDLVWIDEAVTMSQGFIRALMPTVRRPNSEVWWSYNPRYEIDPVEQYFSIANRPPGSIVVDLNWRDNPWFPEVLRREMEFDRQRDPDKYDHVWEGGYIGRSEARVFKDWEVASFEAPKNTIFRFGADWGYATSPTVLVRCFLGEWSGVPGQSDVIANRKGRCLFIDHEVYRIGCAIDRIPALFAGTDIRPQARWSNPLGDVGIVGALTTQIYADSARPETIDYMVDRGFLIERVVKGKASVVEGISFLKSHDIWVHPRCFHTINELNYYSYKVDRQTEIVLDELADNNNHVIDSLRYALEGLRRARSNDLSCMSSGRRISLQTNGYIGQHDPYGDRHVSKGFGSGPSRRRGI